MTAAARPDRGWNGVTVTAAPRRGHGGHDAGHRSGMYRVSSRELHQRIKKKKEKKKESSQRNWNNFYCTFLFGLEETFQLVFF